MKILVVHNAYQHKGGEDSVMEAEVEMLTSRGHAVELFSRCNDDIEHMSKPTVAMQTFWSGPAAKGFEAHLRAFRPDVVHVHNTFPLISPAIYWVADRLRVPVVQTLHNFRLFCPQAMFLRNARVCEDCLGKLPWRGALRGCYRESRLQSTVLAGMVGLHRGLGTWQNKVTRYIALNEFCRKKFIEGGLPAERIVIKPNFVDFLPPPTIERKDFLFVGRLSKEKGVDTLVAAADMFKAANVWVAGSGPEVGLLSGVSNVGALGSLSGEQVRDAMSEAVALVMPSVWYENFPRTLVEAFGCGLPVIASRIGALAELVEDRVTGLLFEPGNPASLAEAMRWALAHPAEMTAMGKAARLHYEENFTAERNYQQLLTIYQGAIAVQAGEQT